MDKKITKDELRKRSSEGGVEDEMSSFEEVKRVLKKLMEEGNVEVVENPTFMMETRRKELERERLRDESTSMSIPVVVEDKKKFLIIIIAGVRGESEAHIAAAIQQPVVDHEEEREREVMGTSVVPPPPSEGSPSSKVGGSPPK